MPIETQPVERGSSLLRELWDGVDDADDYRTDPRAITYDLATVMDRSLSIVRAARDENRLYHIDGKLSDEIVAELAIAGYWGLLVPRKFGGAGATFSQLIAFLSRMGTIDPTSAGLLSVHSCIGPVNQLIHFGSEEQKTRLLPALARGERIGVFGLTEPNAGSDMTALRTSAVRDVDEYIVHGEKLFITNLLPGRTMGLVCKIEGKTAVLIVELPPTETPEFQLVRYGLHSLQHAHNHGCIFNGFRVPVVNRLAAPRDDGLQIAYHGLNRGRIALCANAVGTLRVLLADMLPWVKYRATYGRAIGANQLVAQRIGRIAAAIVQCRLLATWGANALDRGVRGEIEGIVAKTWAAETAPREASLDVLRTHGGRAFLHGHRWGDHLHDFLAPSIYEGENEVLLLALFKAIVKPLVKKLFDPTSSATSETETISHSPDAADLSQRIRASVLKYGAALADEQLLMLDFAREARELCLRRLVQNAPSPTNRFDELLLKAAMPGNTRFDELGRAILAEGWSELEGIPTQEILRPY